MPSLANELGYHHIMAEGHAHARRDIALLYLSRFLRLFAFGAVAPILVLHLRHLGFSDQLVGSFLSLTLLGDVLLSLVVTWSADTIGRRRVLAAGALLMAGSGVVFYFSASYVGLLAAAVLGIVSPSGNEVGPFSAIEVGMLSQLVNPDARVYVLMWYQVLGFIGTSVGALTSGIIINQLEKEGWHVVAAYRVVFLLYSVAAGVKIIASLVMSAHAELDAPAKAATTSTVQPASTDNERQPLLANQGQQAPSVVDAILSPPDEPASLPRLPLGKLVALCFIFSLDAFASSLIPNSFIAYYFRLSFNAPLSAITRTFSAGSLIAGFSQLAAGSIARRLGIILTMVGTHIPAQLITIALAFAPSLASGLTLYIARASIASMDTSVRGAFLAAIIPAESRTRFLGIINVCKTLASAPGPTLSGHLASWGSLRWSFVLCGSLKIIYDLGLLAGFLKAKLEH